MGIYDVLIRYGVSDTADKGAWGDLCQVAVECVNVTEFDERVKEGETKYKETIEGPLPGAWRSAKSICRNAIIAGIALISDNGMPMGKTAIEKILKNIKSETPATPKDTLDVLHKHIAAIDKLLLEDSMRTVLVAVIKDWSDTL